MLMIPRHTPFCQICHACVWGVVGHEMFYTQAFHLVQASKSMLRKSHEIGNSPGVLQRLRGKHVLRDKAHQARGLIDTAEASDTSCKENENCA